jgi:halocyanin-like protein
MNEHTRETVCSRRTLLKAGTGAAAAAATGATGTAMAQSDNYDGYLSDVGNYDGTTIDLTGQSSVTIEVGAGNGLQFAPPAVQVDPGTTVTWEWTGEGGAHNVVAEDGSFESGDPVSEAGTTFEQTFDSEGVVKYFCVPHKASGMKGVVAVGDTAQGQVGTASGGDGGDGGGSGNESSGGGGGGGGSSANQLALQTLVAMLVLGLLSPILFLLVARRKMGGSSQP